MAPGRVLLVAGSDCSGGAGLEAGQKVLAAHGCYAMTATTALTAQSTAGVGGVHVVPAGFVARQMEACLGDIGADVVVTGMLAAADTVEAVAGVVARHAVPAVVVDPVVVSTSGTELLPRDGVRALARRVLPLATLLTPNLPEARLLLDEAGAHDDASRAAAAPLPPSSPSPPQQQEEPAAAADVEALGRRLLALGPRWVLVKGGHLPLRADGTAAAAEAERAAVEDVLLGPGGFVLRLRRPWQASTSTHGTGCSLAAAIAAGLATGRDVPAAVRAACRYVEAGIRAAPGLGRGHGPLGHFHSTYHLPFSPGYFVEYLLGRADVRPAWDRFVHHPFVLALGDGSLPLESFKGYIVQDYLYLIQFARANALAAYKAKSVADIDSANRIVGHIVQETRLHVGYCESFGVSVAEMLATEEKQACTAYSRYVLDVGQRDDWLALQTALAPCVLGYGAVAQSLMADGRARREGNAYWAWVENYAADDYVGAVRRCSQLLEDRMCSQSPSRIEELVAIFVRATEMETAFWEMFPHRA